MLNKVIIPPIPPVIRIEPAGACNLRCTHCPTGVIAAARSIMMPEIFDRAIEEIAKHTPPIRVAVLYHGGEPLLNKHCFEIARRVKNTGIPFVKMVSNGMLIHEGNVDALVTCGLDAIEISLDGKSPQENDLVRRRSKFSRVVAAVHELARARSKHKVAIKFFITTTQFAEMKNPQIDRLPDVPEMLRTAFQDIEGQLEINATWAKVWPSGQPSAGYDVLWDDRERKGPPRCTFIEDTMTIRADGTVVACCYDLTTMSNLGNIMEQSLSDIWRGASYRKFRKGFSTGNYPDLCRGCHIVTGDKFLVRQSDEGRQNIALLSNIVQK